MDYFEEFRPKFFTLLKSGIRKEVLTQDLISGVIVGVVAIPLAIAFAIASGVSPEKGLITAIIAGFLISFLGGSSVQISGPTGAFVVIVLGVVQGYGLDGLIIATFIAGFMLVLFGLIRMGNLLKFIPFSLISGFTSGIAVIIFSSQIRDFFGLEMTAVPAEFFEKWWAYLTHFHTVNGYALGLAAMTVVFSLFSHKITTKVPGSLVAIILSTVLVQVFQLPVETIETKFGEISGSIPWPSVPHVDLATLQNLFKPALAIALLGAIESLLSAAVADGMVGDKHRSNMELVAQGLGNIASAVFGGIPATGAIARTATNVKNGGRTPISGMVHAAVLLVIMLALGPYAKLIPMATLAGILVVVAYNMGEWHSFRSVLRSNRYDALILLTSFTLTVAFDLVLAIEIGVVMSSFVFMKRMSDIAQFNLTETNRENELLEAGVVVPKDVLVYQINSPLFFGVAQRFQETLSEIHLKPRAVIIQMRYVPFMDATGLYRLGEIVKLYSKQDVHVIICEPDKGVLQSLMAYHIIHRDHIALDLPSALMKVQDFKKQEKSYYA